MSKRPAETIDQRRERLAAAFTAIRLKSGMSMEAFARLLGYKRASSIQRYGSSAEHSGQYLNSALVGRLLDSLAGKFGISETEIRALGGPMMAQDRPGLAQPVSDVGSALRQARRQRGFTIRQTAEAAGVDVEVVDEWENGELLPTDAEIEAVASLLNVDRSALTQGTVEAVDSEPLGDAKFISDQMPVPAGPRDVEKLGVMAAGDDGDFEFNGQVAEFVPRPRGLVGRPGVFALEVISESMYPAYRKGDIAFCDRAEPAIGDDVVIETFPEGSATVGKAFIKRLKRRSGKELVVEQFNPPKDLTFERYALKHVWRVVPNRELHGY